MPNDLTKSVNNLLQDFVNRQAAQGNKSGPPTKEWATTTRRQTPLPQVSQRSAQLLQQIIEQGRNGKPGTSSGSQYAKGPVMSRADMISQRDPEYGGIGGQGNGPVVQYQEGPPAPPQLTYPNPQADVPNYVPPPTNQRPPWPGTLEEWDALALPDQVASGYAPPPEAVTRAAQTPENAQPNVAQMGAGNQVVPARAVQGQIEEPVQAPIQGPVQQTIDEYIAAGNYNLPPMQAGAGVSGEVWQGMDANQREEYVARLKDEIAYQSTLHDPGYQPPDLSQVQGPNMAPDVVAEASDAVASGMAQAAGAVYGAIPDPIKDAPAWALGGVIAGASWPKNKWDDANADVLIYMANHNGEMPRWAELIYGSAQAQDPGPPENFNPAHGPWIGDEPLWKRILEYDPTSDVFMVDFVQNNPQFLPEIKAISDAAIAAGEDPTAAVRAWFRDEQSTVGIFIDQIINSPENLLLGLGIPAKILRGKGVVSALKAAEAGKEVPASARALDAGATVLKALSDPLSAPVEAAWKGLAGGFRRVGGPVGEYGAAAARAVADDTLPIVRRTAEELTDPEAAFNAGKAAAAEADIQAARALKVKHDEAVADYENALNTATSAKVRGANQRALKNAETKVVEAQREIDRLTGATSPVPTSGGATAPTGVADDVPAGPLFRDTESMGYLSPGNLKGGQPNLAQRVVDMSLDNPQAARSFADEYEPMATAYMKRNPAGGQQTPINVYDDIGNRVRSEELFIKHFNEQSGYFDNKFMRTWKKETLSDAELPIATTKRLDQGDASAIERSVFGSDADSAEAFDQLVEASTRSGSKVTSKMIDNLSQLRQRYKGISGKMTGDLKPGPVSRNADTAIPESRAYWKDHPDVETVDDVETLKQIAVHGDQGDMSRNFAHYGRKGNRGASIRARARLRNEFNIGHDEAVRLADERRSLYGTKSDNFSNAKDFNAAKAAGRPSSGSMGIVNDPWDRTADAAKSTRAGMGRIVDALGPKPVRETGEIVVDAKVLHGTSLADAVRAKNVTQRQIDDLTGDYTITVKNGKKTEQITTNYWDRFHDNLAKMQKVPKRFPADLKEAEALRLRMRQQYTDALDQTDLDFESVLTSAQRNKVKRELSRATGGLRAFMQFNVATGPKNIFVDGWTNSRNTLLTGQGAALGNVPQAMNALMRGVDEVEMLDLPMMSAIKNTGAKIPNNMKTDVSWGRAEVSYDTVDTSKIGWLNPLNNPLIRKIRGTQDNAFRWSVFANYYNSNLIFERRKFLDFVRQKARNVDDDSLLQDIANLGDEFTPDDVRRITTEHGLTDDSYARTWARQVDDLSQKAGKKQSELFFTYRKTRLDDQVGKVFLFHYYMTRSSALYLKLMLQHPQLIRMEAEFWKESKKNLDSIDGAPDWLKGWIGFSDANGHTMFTNPLILISSAGVMSSVGDPGFAKTRLMQTLNSTGLYVTPLLNAALAIGGWELLQDVTGTGQLRKLIFNAYQEIKNSAWGRKHDMQGVQPDWLMDVENGLVDLMNAALRKVNVPIKDFEQMDSESVKMNKVKQIMVTNLVEQFGSDIDDWPKEATDALIAIESGAENPYVDAALDEYSGMEFDQTWKNMVIPSGAVVRDTDTEARTEAERATRKTPYQQRTEEEQDVVKLADLAALESPEAVTLGTGTNDYYDIGTPRQNAMSDNWTLMVHGIDDPKNMAEIPDEWIIQNADGTPWKDENGETWTVGAIRRMSKDERMDLADQWIASVEVPGGKVASNMEDTGQSTGEFQKFRDERNSARAANPDLDDFLTARTWFLNADNPRATRASMLAVGEDTEFSIALRDYEEYQRSLGVYGEELEVALDQWMTSEAGYAAMMGWQWRTDREPGSALFDVNNPPPWQVDESAESSAFPEKSDKPDLEDVEADFDFSTMTAEDAKLLIQTDSITPKGLKLLIEEGTVTPQVVNQWISDGTLLKEDMYALAAQENLSATDLRYSVEDEYLTMDDVWALIFSPTNELIERVRTANRQRRRDKENKSGQYASNGYGSNGSMSSTNMVERYLMRT